MKLCIIDGCGKKFVARGWCAMHYKRWQMRGHPTEGTNPYTFSLDEAISQRTRRNGECLLWTGSTSHDGYATAQSSSMLKYNTTYVHRMVWIRDMGECIPEGLEIDHLCHVRNCLEVEHMRLVSRVEQVRNRVVSKDSSTGFRGVYYQPATDNYRFEVREYGVTHCGNGYDTAELASEAAEIKRREVYGEDYAG